MCKQLDKRESMCDELKNKHPTTADHEWAWDGVYYTITHYLLS